VALALQEGGAGPLSWARRPAGAVVDGGTAKGQRVATTLRSQLVAEKQGVSGRHEICDALPGP
jgi:hypothetical protein